MITHVGCLWRCAIVVLLLELAAGMARLSAASELDAPLLREFGSTHSSNEHWRPAPSFPQMASPRCRKS
ncbi:MAG: hypothetical protein HWD60_16360 [Defluviicoccus sp.]|nr:MAG: hypothetical protein HWD60_16360 [Defluviicoccus sp.]